LLELQLILEIFARGRASVSEVRKTLEISGTRFCELVERIERTCNELNIPAPFDACGESYMRRYSVGSEFAAYFNMKSESKLKPRLSEYFSDSMIETIMTIANNPYLDYGMLAFKLHISPDALAVRIRKIIAVCKKHDLGNLVRVPAKDTLLIGLSVALLKHFDLPIVLPDPSRFVIGKVSRAVYEFELKTPGKSTSDVAHSLHMTEKTVRETRYRIREKLRQATVVRDSLKCVLDSSATINSAVISYRMQHGIWPTAENINIKIPIVFGEGTIPSMFLTNLSTQLILEDKVRILRHDCTVVSAWDFSKFDESALIQKAFAGALLRGANRGQLAVLMAQSKSDGDALMAANAIETQFGVTVQELRSIPNYHTASNSYVPDEMILE
jgi:hypothetical protein